MNFSNGKETQLLFHLKPLTYKEAEDVCAKDDAVLITVRQIGSQSNMVM